MVVNILLKNRFPAISLASDQECKTAFGGKMDDFQ